MILMMNHLNSMLFGASVGCPDMLASGGALQCNSAENIAENATILWPHCTVIAKSAMRNAMQQSKNHYARSLIYSTAHTAIPTRRVS